MIPYETILKIEQIFRHMQLITLGHQSYDELEEYRARVLIKKGDPYGLNAKEVYCQAEKLTPWHQKIWKKRQKEIALEPFCDWMEQGQVWRLGFRLKV